MLGSFEFPMTQYPIEERRNRVYMNESLLICEPLAFVCHERWAVDGDVATRAWSVVFPASYNPVVGVDVTGDAQTVTFAKRHGLFANGFCVPDNFTLHAAGARVPLEGSRIVDDFTVQIDSKEDCGHGVLYFREPCDVVEMAALLTQRVRKHNPAMRVLVETVTCRLECRIDTYPAPRCESYAVSVSGSLLDFIGLSSFERRFQREPENLLPRSNFGSSEEPLVRDDRPPLVLFSDVVSAWASSTPQLVPSHRNYCHGAPLRSRTGSTFSGTGCTSFPTNPGRAHRTLPLPPNRRRVRIAVLYGIYVAHVLRDGERVEQRARRVGRVRGRILRLSFVDDVLNLFDHRRPSKRSSDSWTRIARTPPSAARPRCMADCTTISCCANTSRVEFCPRDDPRLKARIVGTSARVVTFERTSTTSVRGGLLQDAGGARRAGESGLVDDDDGEVTTFAAFPLAWEARPTGSWWAATRTRCGCTAGGEHQLWQHGAAEGAATTLQRVWRVRGNIDAQLGFPRGICVSRRRRTAVCATYSASITSTTCCCTSSTSAIRA